MRTAIVIGDKLKLTEEALAHLADNPEAVMVVADIFEDDGVTVLALLPEPEQ